MVPSIMQLLATISLPITGTGHALVGRGGAVVPSCAVLVWADKRNTGAMYATEGGG